MRAFVAESGVEEVCLDYFADLGWQVLYGPEIAPGERRASVVSYRDVLLEGRLRAAIRWLNPSLSAERHDQVVATVRRAESADVLAENWRVHRLLTTGVPIERRDTSGDPARHRLARRLRASRAQRFRRRQPVQRGGGPEHPSPRRRHVRQRASTRAHRAEGARAGECDATRCMEPAPHVRGADPSLLAFNAVSVISTGTQARLGALGGGSSTTPRGRRSTAKRWRRRECRRWRCWSAACSSRRVFLDLVRNFVVFSDERDGLVKRVAKYHQF